MTMSIGARVPTTRSPLPCTSQLPYKSTRDFFPASRSSIGLSMRRGRSLMMSLKLDVLTHRLVQDGLCYRKASLVPRPPTCCFNCWHSSKNFTPYPKRNKREGGLVKLKRRCDMCHELLTQCALFLHWSQCKKGYAESALIFVTHVVPPLGKIYHHY